MFDSKVNSGCEKGGPDNDCGALEFESKTKWVGFEAKPTGITLVQRSASIVDKVFGERNVPTVSRARPTQITTRNPQVLPLAPK